MNDRLACPLCATPLRPGGEALRCECCARDWPVHGDVPLLTPEPQWYPKEYVSPEQFETWLADIGRLGWTAAGQRLRDEMVQRGQKERSVESLAFDPSRADFHHLVPLTRDAVVLDYGAGLGSILFGLQPFAGHVVGIDQSVHRARLIRTRAVAEGKSNVTAVCGGNTPRLPFADGTFDLVVMNGVLEWIPRAQRGNPTSIHRRVLREVARVLRPGGALYLAIENRYGYRYLWGRRDSHNAGKKLPYVTVLPRLLADLYTRAASGVPYRTHLHSYRGLRALLRSAAFRRTDFYFPYPTYNQFKYMVPLDADPRDTAFALAHIQAHESLERREVAALQLMARGPLARHLAQDFAVVART